MQVNVISHQMKDIFEKSKNVLIVLGEGENVDKGSLAASLVEIFASYNKKVELLSKTELPLAAKPLVATEKIKTTVEPKSLIISFDYAKNKLDKVSYNLDGNKFNLIITSRGGKIDPKDAVFSYKGVDWDLIVTVGVKNSTELQAFGLDEDSFNHLASINIDTSKENSNFAKLNLVNPNTDSYNTIAAIAFRDGGVVLPTRAAETMLYGMRISTNNFTAVNDPLTFESAAYCKRCMIPGMVGEVSNKVKEEKTESIESEAPENWLSPKIFRSNRVS